jgi:sterol desaturase/sphingolipid hydroxylase (fatty acid hydroxylase superfamily)
VSDTSEWLVRGTAFAVTFALLAAAERRWRFRAPRPRGQWRANASLFAIGTLLVRALPAASLVGLAAFAQTHGIGALAHVEWPSAVELPMAVVALDAGVYAQHRLFHAVPWLWRLHAVHHSDTAFDVTTGIRFHPGETIASLILKGAAIVVVGAAPVAVLAFEVLLNAASLFTHANVHLSQRADRLCRAAIVTPDMHRVHHSVAFDEHERNFGFLIIWWDRLFGSYRAASREDPATMPIGLPAFRAHAQQTLGALLRQPIEREVA